MVSTGITILYFHIKPSRPPIKKTHQQRHKAFETRSYVNNLTESIRFNLQMAKEGSKNLKNFSNCSSPLAKFPLLQSLFTKIFIPEDEESKPFEMTFKFDGVTTFEFIINCFPLPISGEEIFKRSEQFSLITKGTLKGHGFFPISNLEDCRLNKDLSTFMFFDVRPPEVAAARPAISAGVAANRNDEGAPIKKRGQTTCVDIQSMPPGTRVHIEVNENMVPCNIPEFILLGSYLGVVARDPILEPISFSDWRNKGMEPFKKRMLAEAEAKFDFPANIKHWMQQSIGVKWRNYKTSLIAEHWDSRPVQEIMEVVPVGVDPVQWC
ncbi:hypothetical protein MA16_Dca022789 [Dendrobium catenatum]|uniref:Uncharacterized protein n=1 Tax=Dendrobium catenatum TaxID=906689 RepID=A0A2I0X400_9ASPA|nr:hypothetical protein MA16_Dca022789 [Dendrobium catenatum]